MPAVGTLPTAGPERALHEETGARLAECPLTPVAQWIRALPSEGSGRRFKSCLAYFDG